LRARPGVGICDPEKKNLISFARPLRSLLSLLGRFGFLLSLSALLLVPWPPDGREIFALYLFFVFASSEQICRAFAGPCVGAVPNVT
jgi:hypothetical protein